MGGEDDQQAEVVYVEELPALATTVRRIELVFVEGEDYCYARQPIYRKANNLYDIYYFQLLVRFGNNLTNA